MDPAKSAGSLIDIGVVLPSDFEERPTGGMLAAVKNFLKSTKGYPFRITLFGLCWKQGETVGNVYNRTIYGVSYPFIPLCKLTEKEVNGHRPLIPLRAKMFWSCLRNRRVVKRRSCDVLYIHAPELFPLMPGQRAGIVYHAHGTEEWGAQYSRYWICRTSAFRKLYSAMINQIGAHSDQFVCMDQQCYDVYRSRWPARDADIHFAWGTVDVELFKPLPPEVRKITRDRYVSTPTGKVLLFVGRLTQLKGVHLIIEAVAHLKRTNPDMSFWIVGNGEEEDSLRKQIAEANLGSSVRLLGKLPHDELPPLYNSADLTIVASEQESLCFTILESLACGTPVISTRVGVAPHVIHDGRSGFLLDKRSVDDIIRGIEAGLTLPVEAKSECVESARSLGTTARSVQDLILDLGRRRA